MRVQRIVVVALLLLGTTSCGQGRKPCFPVKGEVFFGKDKDRVAAKGAKVSFYPLGATANDWRRSTAMVDDKGTFQVTTYEPRDGAPAGDYTITIEWHQSRRGGKGQGPDKLEGAYSGDPTKAEIRFTVEKKKLNVVPTIELQ
jgi:hypothetical protein